MDWQSYKSGTDIRFTAVETPTEFANVTAETIDTLVRAFSVWLKRRSNKDSLRVGVGHDSRISADWIYRAAIDALRGEGHTVMGSGLCSTPSMFGMTRYPETDCDGAIMITASHHPYQKNGLKFFVKKGGLQGADIAEILNIAQNDAAVSANLQGTLTERDYMGLYVRSLLDTVRKATGEHSPLQGFRIVTDAGNGAGGFFVERVLAPLGADCTGSQFLEPDGMFPNHIPNPENGAAMRAISDCVVQNKADLGIIFDTDVDRAAVVASDGKEINRNRLIALLSAIVLKETPNATIVTDSVTSDGLKTFIEKLGGKHRRFKRGYKNVIDEAIRLEKCGIDAPLAIETSGHAALKENAYLDDGAYVVVKILITMVALKKQGKLLTDLIADLEEPCEEAEVRLGLRADDWKEAGARALSQLENAAKLREDWQVAADSCEGVRIGTPQGFFLVRMSVHDPVMPVNVESRIAGGVKTMLRELYEVLKNNAELDIANLAAQL